MLFSKHEILLCVSVAGQCHHAPPGCPFVLNLVLHYCQLSHCGWWRSELQNRMVWLTWRLNILLFVSTSSEVKFLFQTLHPLKKGERHPSPGSTWVIDGATKDPKSLKKSHILSSEAPSSQSSDVSTQPGVTAETRGVKRNHGGEGAGQR